MARLQLKVAETSTATPQIRAIALVDADGGALPGFDPGAHIRVQLPDGTNRPYSLINLDPALGAGDSRETYRLGVRLEEDSQGGSRYMHELKAGDIVSASAAQCDFHLIDSNAPALLIAGGIGVTPIMTMAAALTAADRPFAFHYAARAKPLMAFADEIAALCGDNFTVHFDDDPASALDLKALIGAHDRAGHIYVCGPRGMIEAAREIAHDAGFAKDHIHFELFAEAEHKTGDSAFEIEIKSTGQVFTVPADKTIIDVLEAEGLDPLYDCQRGDCGICQVDVLDGIPDHRDVILTDSEKAANNVMQICVSRAKSPRLVLDL